MSTAIRFAAVWPEKAEKKHSEVVVVSVSHLRHFNPSHKKDFDYAKFLRLKRPGEKHATLVQVLALGESETGVRAQMQGARWPRRGHTPASSKPLSTKKEQLSPKTLSKKTVDRNRIMEVAIGVRSLVDGVRRCIDRPSSQPGTQHESQHEMETLASSLSKEVMRDMRQGIMKELRQSLCELMGAMRRELRQGMLQELRQSLHEELMGTRDPSLQDLSEKVANLSEELNSFKAAAKVDRDTLKEQLQSAKKCAAEEVARLKEEVKALQAAVKSGTSREVPLTSPTVSAVVWRKPPTTTAGEEIIGEDLGGVVKKIHIGKKVYAEATLWQAAKEAKNPSCWATFAMQAVYGDNAKYYRTRQPRKKNTSLQAMSEQELAVLKCHYKTWLQDHPRHLDGRDKEPRKVQKGLSAKEKVAAAKQWKERELEATEGWLKRLAAESEEDKAARRGRRLVQLLDRFQAFLGDKAQDLYRIGAKRRRSTAADPLDVDSDVLSRTSSRRDDSSRSRSSSRSSSGSRSSSPCAASQAWSRASSTSPPTSPVSSPVRVGSSGSRSGSLSPSLGSPLHLSTIKRPVPKSFRSNFNAAKQARQIDMGSTIVLDAEAAFNTGGNCIRQ